MVRHYFKKSNYVPPPPVTVPPPVLVFSSLGDDKATYAKSGNTVTGATLATGQTFTGNYNLTTEIDPAHNGAEVLVCGYGAYLDQNGLLPASMYGNGARDFLAVVQAPPQNRELFGYGANDFNPLQQFDIPSLPTAQNPEENGIGVHMNANQGTLPNIPTRTGYQMVWVGYDPTGGVGVKPGRLDMSDEVNSNFFNLESLGTGSDHPAQRRGLSIGMGSFGVIGGGGLGQAPSARFLYLAAFDVKLTPAQRAVYQSPIKTKFNL